MWASEAMQSRKESPFLGGGLSRRGMLGLS